AIVGGEIELAESDLAHSEDRLQWAKRMFEKKYVSQAQKDSEELTRKKARFALEQAQSKRAVLVQYTKGKTVMELYREAEKAKSDELAKEEAWDSEKSRENRLERQLRQRTN